MGGNIQVPKDSLAPLIPDAFRTTGQVPATADIAIRAIECGRVAANDSVLTNVAWFGAYAWVTPTNESWGKGAGSLYTLDVWVTNADLRRTIDSAGQRATVAQFTSDDTDSGAGPTAHRWRFQSGAASIDLEFQGIGRPTQTGDTEFFQWTKRPTGAFLRTEERESYIFDRLILDGGVVRTEGSVPWAQLSSPCCAQWYGTAVDVFNSTWAMNQTPFGPR